MPARARTPPTALNQPLVSVNLESIRAPIAADLAALDEVIRRRLDSEVVLVRTIADYIIAAGGKRLRPALLLLTATGEMVRVTSGEITPGSHAEPGV